MKKILILEDNQIAMGHLESIIRDINPGILVFPVSNVKDAYACVMERIIDVFIIDIILDTSDPGDTSGLKFAENIRKMRGYGFTPIIFVTSLEDARQSTYEHVHCYQFIEKPFDVKYVRETIVQCLRFPGFDTGNKMLYFKKDGIIVSIARDDLVYAETISHIMHIHSKQGDVLKIPYITVRKLLEYMDSPDMLQCSRSTIVNIRYIKNIDIINQVVQLKNPYGSVDIGITYKKYLKEMLK